jgi:hypothetical protein
MGYIGQRKEGMTTFNCMVRTISVVWADREHVTVEYQILDKGSLAEGMIIKMKENRWACPDVGNIFRVQLKLDIVHPEDEDHPHHKEWVKKLKTKL